MGCSQTRMVSCTKFTQSVVCEALYFIICVLVPGKVTSLLLSRLSGNSTNIRWSPPASLRGVILGYEVAYTPRGSLTQIHSSLMHSASTSLVIQGLSPNQAYDVRVRARTVAGYGPYSSTETAPGLITCTSIA